MTVISGAACRRMTWAAVAAAALASPAPVQAGPAADVLRACVLRATTATDREALTRFLFVTLAAHPSTNGIAAVAEPKREALLAGARQVIMRINTKDCRAEYIEALLSEGGPGASPAYRALGDTILTGLMEDPTVFRETLKGFDVSGEPGAAAFRAEIQERAARRR